MKRTFTSEDGTTFASRVECRQHEELASFEMLLSNLTIMDVQYALDRANTHIDLADAIERAGNIIAAKRRANGELKRKAKNGNG